MNNTLDYLRLNPAIASVLVNYEDYFGKKKGREMWDILVVELDSLFHSPQSVTTEVADEPADNILTEKGK